MKIWLDQLALEDEESGDLTIVVETPRGSRNKYKYDSSCHALRLGALLPEGLAFPFDFGFFPSTLGEDGDPLDVPLLLDTPVPAGCIVNGRLIGAIEVEQKEGSGSWKRNDRFLAVGSQSSNYADVARLRDLRPPICWTRSKRSSCTTSRWPAKSYASRGASDRARRDDD